MENSQNNKDGYDDFLHEMNRKLKKYEWRNSGFLVKENAASTFSWLQDQQESFRGGMSRKELGDEKFNLALELMAKYNSLMLVFSCEVLDEKLAAKYLAAICIIKKAYESI